MTSVLFKKNILEKINKLNKLNKNNKQVSFILSTSSGKNHLIKKINSNIGSLKNLNDHLSYLIREIDESLNKR